MGEQIWNSWKWLEMSVNCGKWLKKTGNGWTSLQITGLAGTA